MKKFFIAITIIAAFLPACTEETDLRSLSDHEECLAVEAVLTDRTDVKQVITLSRTVPYFEEQEPLPMTGAKVSVSDGEQVTWFDEEEGGTYAAQEGFHAEEGRSYHLRIELPGGRVHEADASMPSNGFRIDGIDYAFAGNKTMGLDSLWTVAIWGKDMERTDYYYVTAGVNGNMYPFAMSEVTDDKYFNGSEVKGFPIASLMQYSQLQEIYGDCFKYLEAGDVITLEALTIQKEFYDYLVAVVLNGTMPSMPLFSPQPANCPTNLSGDNVVGFFAVCPSSIASVSVDDPLRPYYLRK